MAGPTETTPPSIETTMTRIVFVNLIHILSLKIAKSRYSNDP